MCVFELILNDLVNLVKHFFQNNRCDRWIVQVLALCTSCHQRQQAIKHSAVASLSLPNDSVFQSTMHRLPNRYIFYKLLLMSWNRIHSVASSCLKLTSVKTSVYLKICMLLYTSDLINHLYKALHHMKMLSLQTIWVISWGLHETL